VTVLLADRDGAGPAVRVGDLVLRDETRDGNVGLRRYFWLLGHGAQLVYEPFDWTDEWKVDIVAFERHVDHTERIDVHDLIVDFVVEGMGPTYRILDLDELAVAVVEGRVAREVAARALQSAQAFVDSFLHRGAEFPPAEVRTWFRRNHQYPPLPLSEDHFG
jgi:hypothetical protein